MDEVLAGIVLLALTVIAFGVAVAMFIRWYYPYYEFRSEALLLKREAAYYKAGVIQTKFNDTEQFFQGLFIVGRRGMEGGGRVVIELYDFDPTNATLYWGYDADGDGLVEYWVANMPDHVLTTDGKIIKDSLLYEIEIPQGVTSVAVRVSGKVLSPYAAVRFYAARLYKSDTLVYMYADVPAR